MPHLLALALAALLCLGACDNDRDELDVPGPDLVCLNDEPPVRDAGLWQSSDWETGWIKLATNHQVTVVHGLGRDPILAVPYVSFDETQEYRSSSVGAGQVAEVIVGCPPDQDLSMCDDDDAGTAPSHCVVVRNRTPGSFYVRLVLH